METSYLKVFVDWLERYQKLSDAEFGRLVRAALMYKKDGAEMELTGREELLWDGIKLDIDRDNERYNSVCQARSEAGKQGAEARWHGKSQSVDNKNSKCHLSHGKNSQEEEKEEEKDKDIKSKRFIPPTVEEVAAYCFERHNKVNPQRFVSWYEANGWKVGKNPMKNWKAAVRTWEDDADYKDGKPKRSKYEGLENLTAAEERDFRNRYADVLVNGVPLGAHKLKED